MTTQTLNKSVVINPSRNHDYLYDNNFILSSERDHARATFKAHTNVDRVKRVPIFKTMFSELRHHPRFQMRLDVTDPVPKVINRQWRGYADQQRDAMIRYKTFNYDPSVSIPARQFENPNVSGVNRYKYFRRPIIPFLQQVPPEVVLATARHDPLAAQEMMMMERPPTPLTRTVEVQTDYRDSEAQTDPYTPEYVIRPGSQPELLTLATLSFGRGLPAGLAEVEMIERARAKRAWEATLPPLNDTSQLDKRRKMMDEMETKEWALREQEIEKLQEARLEVLKKLLIQREENHQDLNVKRLDKLWTKKQEEKERKLKKIRNEHIKSIRKLTQKRKNVEGKFERRNLVQDYANYGSQAYAPMTRIGVFLDQGSEQYLVKSRYLNSYQGLLELENSMPDYVVNPRINAPKPKTVTKSGFVKRKFRQERELAEIHEVIKEYKSKTEEEEKPLRFLEKIEKPVPRPPTPSIDVPSQSEEDSELAVIFLQQVIRGRAIQNMMFEGKEKRTELIKELRSTHALQEAEQTMKKQERQATLALQRQRRIHENKESFIDEALSQMEGASLGDTMDFLSKELIRLQEERRIHAFAMLAERRRRIREAEESGRRQVEERRRREEDEIFKQSVKVHQQCVETYLEDIILGAVDATADEQSRNEVKEQAIKINDIAYEMEENRTELQTEEICAELTHCFLLPEVQKQTVRDKIKMQQRKYLQAAHKEIHKDGEETIQIFAKSNTQSGSRRESEASQKSPEPKPQSPVLPSSPVVPSSTERPPSGRQSSRPPSAQSSKAGSKPPSRKSSGASIKSSGAVPDRQPSPKLEITGHGAGSAPGTPKESGSRRGSAGSSKAKPESAPGTPKESGSRRGSASSQKAKLESAPGTPKESGSRRESTSSQKGKPESAPGTPKDSGSRRGSASSQKGKPESAPGTPKESGSRRESTSSQKGKPESAPGTPKESGSRKCSASSLKEKPETPKQSRPTSAEKTSSRRGSASSQKEPSRTATPTSPKGGSPKNSRPGSAAKDD